LDRLNKFRKYEEGVIKDIEKNIDILVDEKLKNERWEILK